MGGNACHGWPHIRNFISGTGYISENTCLYCLHTLCVDLLEQCYPQIDPQKTNASIQLVGGREGGGREEGGSEEGRR